jgi:hypothetical protein
VKNAHFFDKNLSCSVHLFAPCLLFVISTKVAEEKEVKKRKKRKRKKQKPAAPLIPMRKLFKLVEIGNPFQTLSLSAFTLSFLPSSFLLSLVLFLSFSSFLSLSLLLSFYLTTIWSSFPLLCHPFKDSQTLFFLLPQLREKLSIQFFEVRYLRKRILVGFRIHEKSQLKIGISFFQKEGFLYSRLELKN